jgi:hypothetical protein
VPFENRKGTLAAVAIGAGVAAAGAVVFTARRSRRS